MNVAGKWVVLVDDEDFAPGRNRVVELGPEEREDGDKLIVDLSPHERAVLTGFDEGAGVMAGNIYRGDNLPDGDPGDLWRELEAAGNDDDPRWDELPISDYVRFIGEKAIN